MRRAATAIGLALLLMGRAARAEPRPEVPFKEGRALQQQGMLAEAASKFEESIAIKPTIGALLNAGDCYEKLGRYASAVSTFDRARVLAEQEADADRGREAATRGDALRSSISTLKIHLEGAPLKPKVTLDGTPVTVDYAVPVDGGVHALRVGADCRRDRELTVTVGAKGDAKYLTVALELDRDDPSCNETDPPPAPKRSFRGMELAAGGLAVGALAGFGVGIVGTAIALTNKGDLESACRDYPRGCPEGRRAELDDVANAADGGATIATVGLVVGTVLLAGAVTLYFLGVRGAKSEKRSALLSVGTF